MQALAGPPGELAAAALAAGCDLVLHCTGVLEESAALLQACPPITAEAEARLERAQAAARRAYQALDPAALLVERDGLLA
jgi:beta-N-acetylhexosaminidase